MPIVFFIIMGFCHLFDSFGLGKSFDLAVQSNLFPHNSFAHPTPLFWDWLAVGLFGTALICAGVIDELWGGSGDGSVLATGFTIVSILGLSISLIASVVTLVNNDKAWGQYYNASTVIHISDPNTHATSSLNVLIRGSHPGQGWKKADGKRCDFTGGNDVPSCVKIDGSADTLGWKGRDASAASASQLLDNTASKVNRVDLMASTVTYLPTKDSGRWSGVLDGSGTRQAMYGVGETDPGSSKVTVCKFEGDHQFNRAFDGGKLNSLRNLIDEKYPKVVFDDTDIWGYCDGSKPVVVIPVSRQIAYEAQHRTVMTAGGVLVLKGSPNGDPVMTYKADVSPGELPGPVYPLSIVEAQRDSTTWASGREAKNRYSFGYTTVDVGENVDNEGEFLMEDSNGRLVYMTPVRPNGSRTKSVTGYLQVAADTVHSGNLNTLNAYLMSDDDVLSTNPNTLIADAQTAVSNSQQPNFLQSQSNGAGGKLEEIIPLGGSMWQVFGVRRGVTEFKLTLDASHTKAPAFEWTGKSASTTPGVPAAPGQPQAPVGAGPVLCDGKLLKGMTASQLQACQRAISDEFNRRLAQMPTPAVSATPSPTPTK
jgi:hypothetical protein